MGPYFVMLRTVHVKPVLPGHYFFIVTSDTNDWRKHVINVILITNTLLQKITHFIFYQNT